MAADKIFFVFPGQGSQYRGMGSDLHAEFSSAREIYARASAVVGYDMAELSFEDPRGELDQTRYTQPALLTHEVACLEVFRGLTGGRVAPDIVAGHSLGEYAALVAAGALEFEAALGLVAERGRLMGELGRGKMLAMTLDLDAAALLADRHFCGIGGCNLPEQTVVAGHKADLDALVADMAENFPGKRAIPLNTEGAFHTYLMVGAAEQFRPVLEAAEFAAPAVDVLSNYTGGLHSPDAAGIRSRLFFQLFNPVRWTDCMKAAIESGADRFIEFGGGIGKGEGPESKRPNLETIVKKSLKWHGHQANYAPAINVAGIRAAAEHFSAA